MKHGQSQHFRVRRLVWLVGVCLVIVLIAVTVEGVQFFQTLRSFKEEQVIKHYQDLANKSVSTFLLLGLDNSGKRKLSTSRTDGMMVVIVNHKTKTITLCSLLRDTFTKIYSQQYHGYQRIETAYTYGGYAAAVATVEHFLKLPIDYYVTLNWDGFIQAINDIGPLSVRVDRAFVGQNYWGHAVHFKAGLQEMNGARALAYARERHVDNDQYRGFRQQAVLYALLKRLNQGALVAKGSQIMGDVKGQVRTNMSEGDMLSLIKYRTVLKHYRVKRVTFQWRTFDTAGRSMVEVYPDSRQHTIAELQAAAGRRASLPQGPFVTNGHYLYNSDETVQSAASEAKADTDYGNPHVYIGESGNTKTGRLPIEVPLTNGFRQSDHTPTAYPDH